MEKTKTKQALRKHRQKVVRDTETIVDLKKKVNDVPAENDDGAEEEFVSSTENTLAEWKSPEFIYYEKTRRWYLIAVLIFAALIAFAIYSQSFLMAVTFVVAGGVFYLYAQKKPAQLDIAITDEGVQYHDRFFAYEEIDGFWITYEPPDLKLLTLSTRQLLFPKLSIVLTDQDPVELRKILIEELPEDKKLQDTALDAFSRRIRF